MTIIRHVRPQTLLHTGMLLLASSLLSACGNGGSGNASIFALFVGPAQVLDAGQTTTVTASIVNDSNPGGATFSVTGGGTLSSATTTYVGSTEKVSVTYTAPASPTIATVTATSVYKPAQSFSVVLTVNPALTITTTTLPAGTIGVAYSASISATGGTGKTTFALGAGTLPAGLSFDPVSATISGTPTAVGNSTLTVQVTDSAPTPFTAVQTYNLTVNSQPPAVTPSTLSNAIAGVAYGQQLAYTGGGTGTATWAITAGSLPTNSGLTLNSNGLISGTPTISGVTYSFSVAVTVGTQTSAAVPFTIQVLAPLVVTTTSLPSGHVAVAYSQQLTYTGGSGAPTWSIVSGSLPASSGLTLSASGLISGSPLTAGAYSFSVAVAAGVQTSAAQALSLTVTSTQITSGTSATGEVGLPFAYPLTAVGGATPYTWTLASGSAALPPGLTINPGTGLISGTPTSNTGSPYSGVIVQATDTRGAAGTQTMTFTIKPSRGASNNATLSGHYAFLLTGFDALGNPTDTAGQFIADGNGNVTGGVLDTNGTVLSAAVTNAALSASTYSVGTDNRGKLTLTSSAGSTTYVISLNSLSHNVAAGGTMAEFDASGQVRTGSFALQSSTAFTTTSISGGYAFGVYGFAANSTATSARRSGTIGEFQVSATGTISSAEILGSSSTTPVVSSVGTVTLAANGRGTLSLVLPNAGGTINFVLYVLSPAEMYILSADPASGTGATTRDLLAGQAVVQTTSSGSFNNATLDGLAVFHSQSLGTNGAGTLFPDVQVGLYTSDGAGNLTLSSDENAGGVITARSSYGAYTTAPNGRVSTYLLNSGISGCLDCSKVPTFFYLAGTNRGFSLDFNSSGSSGAFEPQMSSAFTNTSWNGSYSVGSIEPLVAPALVESGNLVATGTGTVTGMEDQVAASVLTPDVVLNGTYTTSASGRLAIAISSNGSSAVIYLVSPSGGWSLDLSSATPVLQKISVQ